MDILTINGKPLSDFDTFFDGKDLFTTPEKDITMYSVVGRSGDLTISNNRFMNIDRTIHCFIRDNFRINYNNLINYLYSQDGYTRFESTKEPDVYMMALFKNSIEPQTGSFLKSGKFDLTFNFMPKKWLKTGEYKTNVSSSKTLVNPTLFDCKPLILVSGTGSITINGIEMTLSANTSTTTIDCETEDCYEDTINRNSDLIVANGFPVLTKGENTISVDGCTIDIIPRWWRL